MASRAATWDEVDADLEMIQRDATFRAADGPLRVLARVRASLAELRHVQGESEPRLPDGFYARKIAESTDSYFKNRPETEIQPNQISHTPENLKTTDPVGDAKNKGMTGEACQQCYGFNTIRNGTCLTCLDCYWSGECG